MTGNKQDYRQQVEDYIDIFRRRKIWVLIPVVAGVLISTLLILFLPKIYRSTTFILVEAQKVPEEYVKSAVSGPVEGRLSTIKQQILSRSFLQKIIDRLGLSKEGSQEISSGDLIGQMQKDIEVSTVGTRNVSAFSISFDGKDPLTVMNITNELASLFIEENLKIREQLVEGTSEFLDNELNSLKETLERQENQIGEFKRNHMGGLPQQLDANLRALDRFQTDFVATQLSRKTAQDRISMLEKTIEMTRQHMDGFFQQNQQSADEEKESPLKPGVPLVMPHASLPPPPPPSPLVLRLIQRRKDLADLRAEYKENYPDVIMLRREVLELEEQVALSEVGERVRPPTREEAIRPIPVEKKEPKKPLTLFTREAAYIADLQKEIQAVRMELKGFIEREKGLQEQIQTYERRVENAPAREQELAILLRDYENTKKNYQILLDKKLNAKISENLEKRQKGERFRILDPANLPEAPFKPDRVKVGLAGILLGLGSGVGLGFIREKLDSSVHKPEKVEQLTSVPVLALIPDFTGELKGLRKLERQGGKR